MFNYRHPRSIVNALAGIISIRSIVRLHLVFPSETAWSTSQTSLILEHILGLGIDGPVVALTRLAQSHALRYLNKAFVETEIVAYRIFPTNVLTAEEVESIYIYIYIHSFGDKFPFDIYGKEQNKSLTAFADMCKFR